jgi:hypothetical protein
MSNAAALPRLRVRRWKPPSPEFMFHSLISLAGLMFVADSAIRVMRGNEVSWSVIRLVGWSWVYMGHRADARRAKLGPVAPIPLVQWMLLAVLLALAAFALAQDLL